MIDLNDRLEREITPGRTRLFETRLGRALLEGTITLPLYKGYLRETYHFVKHTPRFLSVAASRFTGEQEGLRRRFIDHAKEEHGHDLLALHDLEALGTPRAEVIAATPLVPTQALVAFHYMQADRLDPIGLLGTIYALEGLGNEAGPKVAQSLRSLGLPRGAITFIAVHGELDVEHIAEAKKMIAEHVHTPAEAEAVVNCARAAYELYAAMFEGIFARDGAV